MEGGGEAAAPPQPLYSGGGAGGKFQKRPFRKRASTPYDRPPPPLESTAARSSGGWLSRLADPASRLLAAGATRLFFPFFSQSPSLSDKEMNQETGEKLPDDNCVEKTLDSSNELPKDNCLGQMSELGEQLGHHEDGPKSGFDDPVLDAKNSSNSGDGSTLAEIELLFSQKTFSRDEFNRLTEILRSRTTDLSDDDGQGKNTRTEIALAGATGNAYQVGVRRSDGENDRVERLDDGVVGRTPVPSIQSTIYEEVGASPADIAKAFMGSKTSALNLSSQFLLSKDERLLPSNDCFASSSSIPPTPSKSPICWPGAVVKEVPGCLASKAQSGTIKLHDFPRTPYNRIIHSRSTSKVRKNRVLDNGYMSVQSNHNTYLKSLETPLPKGPAGSTHSASPGLLLPSTNTPESVLVTVPGIVDSLPSKVSKTELYLTKRKLHQYSASSTVHPHSSVMARRILEHLDRTVPSPKEKANELQLAILGHKSSPEFGIAMPSGHHSHPEIGPGSLIKDSSISQEPCQEGGGDARTVVSHIKDNGGKAEKGGVLRDTDVSASDPFSKRNENFCKDLYDRTSGDYSWLTYSHNQNDQKVTPVVVGSSASSNGLKISRNQPPFGNTPALTSISVTKPDGKHVTLPDNGSGFTFPISASPMSLSEPPTPTIVPSFVSKTTEPSTTTPTFTFGSKPDKGPVFSFSSTVGSGIVDASIPKFNFGLEKKARISFRLVGKDAMCF